MAQLPETIYLGADHGGYALKQYVGTFIKQQYPTVKCIDLGTNDETSVDYPDYGFLVGQAVAQDLQSLGIIICGTGIGISIAANKIKGIRAALAYDIFTAQMAREHNNANVLALGGRTTTPELAIKIIQNWLETPFAGERHARRVEKLNLK